MAPACVEKKNAGTMISPICHAAFFLPFKENTRENTGRTDDIVMQYSTSFNKNKKY